MEDTENSISSWLGKRREAPSARLKSRPSAPCHPARPRGVNARNKYGHGGVEGSACHARQA